MIKPMKIPAGLVSSTLSHATSQYKGKVIKLGKIVRVRVRNSGKGKVSYTTEILNVLEGNNSFEIIGHVTCYRENRVWKFSNH